MGTNWEFCLKLQSNETYDDQNVGYRLSCLRFIFIDYLPLDSGGRLSAQAAQQFAGITGLHDSGTEEESEARRGLAVLLPEGIRKGLAPSGLVRQTRHRGDLGDGWKKTVNS